MPNRSKYSVPAIYVHTSSDWDISGSRNNFAYPLDIFDVTYVHFHNTLELGYCVSGEGVCYVEEKEYSFKQGDAQIIFPFQRHISKSLGSESSRWYWLYIDPVRIMFANGFNDVEQVEKWLHNEISVFGIVRKSDLPAINRIIKQIIFTNFNLDDHVHKNNYLSASLYLLILELCEASKETPPLHFPENPEFNRLLPALNRIKTDLEHDSKSKVSCLADLCCMSVSNFRKTFSKSVGISPKEYILTLSMRKAMQLLLASHESIINIGLSVGYNDISGFNKCFFAHTGKPPSEFRALYSKIQY